MGWINLLMKGRKVAGKALKKAGKRVKEEAPFVGVAGAVAGSHHLYKKIKGEPTFVDIGKKIIKKYKKNGNKN
jgi:hypothetical protein|tara:strand:+ start:765 stop:983 length:219 start_codon:yes stop_codon:yes gene_type:complete